MTDLEPVRHFLLVSGISVARLTAACSIVPFMSSSLVPGRVRNSIIFAWGLMVYPIVAPSVDIAVAPGLSVLVLIFKEVLMGLLIGFLAAKAFWIAMSVGFFVDNQRGASMASVFDPASGAQTSPIGEFLQHGLIALFYMSGGFLVFLGGLFESYLLWPIGSFFPSFSEEFPELFGRVFAELIMTIVLLAAPVIITLFVSEFGLGMMNRFAPQLNVFFLAMPLKCMVALFVLIYYLPILMSLLNNDLVGPDAIFDYLKSVIS